jgi:hypothetical protein
LIVVAVVLAAVTLGLAWPHLARINYLGSFDSDQTAVLATDGISAEPATASDIVEAIIASPGPAVLDEIAASKAAAVPPVIHLVHAHVRQSPLVREWDGLAYVGLLTSGAGTHEAIVISAADGSLIVDSMQLLSP